MSYTFYLFCYLVVINLLTFFYFGFDKMQSRAEGARRIRERTLWLLSLIGGSIGALLGMKFFRHKTKKVSFQAVMIVIVLIQLVLIFLLVSHWNQSITQKSYFFNP